MDEINESNWFDKMFISEAKAALSNKNATVVDVTDDDKTDIANRVISAIGNGIEMTDQTTKETHKLYIDNDKLMIEESEV